MSEPDPPDDEAGVDGPPSARPRPSPGGSAGRGPDAPRPRSEPLPVRRRRRPTWRRRLRRWRRRARYGRRYRLVRRIVLYGAAGIFLLAAGWLVVTALLVKSDLKHIESRISTVKRLVAAGRIDEARHAAQGVPAMARDVHGLTTGPVWWLASKVPYAGRPIVVVRGTTLATHDLGVHAVPQLLAVAARIDPAQLRENGNTIRIAPLVRAAPDLERSATTIDRIVERARRLPDDTWLGFVNSGRASLVGQLTSVRGYVSAAARVARVLPPMLGEDGTKRYFVGLQNEAELRGTGGLPGAFTIVEATHGTIRFSKFESDQALLPGKTHQLIATGLNFGPDYNQLYASSSPTTSFPDSNVSPDFPYAAQIWAAMWQKVSGQRIDGAVAVDPTALAFFLAATGPAQLPDGPQVNSDDVVSLTQKDNYAAFSDNAKRKAFLVSVLRAAASKITGGAGQPLDLVNAASLASRQQRLLVWTRDPATQRLIEQTNFAGTLPRANTRPVAAVVLNNSAAGKLDYYLGRSLNYVRTGCGSRRDVTATIELRNGAPASGLSTYVTDRLDRPPPGARVGDYSTLLDYFAGGGTRLQSVTLNGKPSTAAVYTLNGLSVFRMLVELPRDTTQTIVLHLDEPAGTGRPVIWRQPGVTPIATQVFNQTCS